MNLTARKPHENGAAPRRLSGGVRIIKYVCLFTFSASGVRHSQGRTRFPHGRTYPKPDFVPPILIPQDDTPLIRRVKSRHWGSFAVSFIFHAVALILLASFALSVGGGQEGLFTLTFSEADPNEPLIPEDTPLVKMPPTRFGELKSTIDMRMEAPEVPAPAEISAVATTIRDNTFTPDAPATADLLRASDADVRKALAGRNPGTRQAMVGGGETSAVGEKAVERGLRWIMSKQQEDGGWSFKLDSRSANPGTEESRTAATAMALLPFLGAGYTQKEGPYTDVVGKGLYFLQQRAVMTPNGANLQDGTMYGQGLATIALCEAYAMTEDPTLRDLAQRSIRYIAFAQATDGGWRYTPGEPGDTTVTGWQLMALKSGQMARLNVPTPTVAGVHRFLDSVQSEYGSLYGYMTPQPRNSTTSIGLLCRMYTGWPRSEPGLERGVGHLIKWGWSENDLYYDYYATQVLHHWGGPEWKTWNKDLSAYLVKTQATKGMDNGSWYLPDPHAAQGGRLYCTSLAVMILEVSYRYMPIYKEQAFEEE